MIVNLWGSLWYSLFCHLWVLFTVQTSLWNVISGFLCDTNWPSVWFDCFGFIQIFVSVTLCDVTNISNIYIYIYMNLWILFLSLCVMWLILIIYINLCLSVCNYFGFRFFFFFWLRSPLFFSWCIKLWNMELMKHFFLVGV